MNDKLLIDIISFERACSLPQAISTIKSLRYEFYLMNVK